MLAKRYMHMRNAIARAIAPSFNSGIESFKRLLAPIQTSVSNRQAKPRSPSELSCLFVERDCIIEAAHLAIQRRERWLTIVGKRWIKLERALSSRDRFIVKT